MVSNDGTLQGYNHQTLGWLTGPGHFTLSQDGDEVLFDYTVEPTTPVDAFPPLKSNTSGLSTLVYGHMVDRVRRVSTHTVIGKAFKKGKAMTAWLSWFGRATRSQRIRRRPKGGPMRWILFLLWCVPSIATAQVNVEKLRSGGIDDGFSGSAGLTSAFSTGNIQLADIGLSASKAYKREHHTIFSVLNGRFAAKRTQSDLQADPETGLWDKDARFANA